MQANAGLGPAPPVGINVGVKRWHPVTPYLARNLLHPLLYEVFDLRLDTADHARERHFYGQMHHFAGQADQG